MNQPPTALASLPSIGFWSHPGKVRAENEDRFYVPPANLSPQIVAAKGYLCVVADGMGGHAKGAVASEIAARRVADVYYADPDPNPETALRRAIQTANADVFVASQNPGMEGMGTTVVACVTVGGQTIIANVGDSRAYLVSRRQAIQITRDHSVVQNLVDAGIITPEQAEQHPDRNRILRAVGVKPSVEVDMFMPATAPGDLIVLCSDGLSNLVRKEEIAQIASSASPQNAAKQLGTLANDRGGHDNITVVILPAAAGAGQAYRQPARASALVPVMAGAMLFLVLGVFAVAAFLASQARPTPPSIAAGIPAPTSIPVATITPPAPTALPPATATRPVSPTPSSTPTHTPTHTPIPTPTIPRGEVVYEVGPGATIHKLMRELGIPSDPTTFYNRHPELWLTPAGGNINSIKTGNLILKWEELDPAVGLSAAQTQPGKMLWMAVLVNDEILATRGLNLTPHKGKPVLVRGMWKDGAWEDDPTVNVMFIWYPQSNRYGQVGRVPPVATPAPTSETKDPGRDVLIKPQPPPEPPQPPPSPEPTPQPSPSPEPTPPPPPSPEPTPQPSPSPEPTPQPSPSPKPTQSP